MSSSAARQVLATKVRKTLSTVRKDGQPIDSAIKTGSFNYSTTRLMKARER